MQPQPHVQRYWIRAVGRLRFRINCAAWLEKFGPAIFAVITVLSVGTYLARRIQIDFVWPLVAVSAGLLLAACYAWWTSRKRFFAEKDARVLLEYQLGLNSGLSAATEGAGPWPVPRSLPDCIQWRFPTSLMWVLGAIGLLICAWILPLPEKEWGVSAKVEKPPAIAQVEAWLDTLKQMEIAEPKSVEAMQEKVQALTRRDTEDMYSHSALEAADQLREQTAGALMKMAVNLQAMSAALDAFDAMKGQLNAEEQKVLDARLSEALQGLKEGALSPNADMLAKLSDLSASQMANLSPEQLKQLSESLGKCANGVMGICTGAGSYSSGAKQQEISIYSIFQKPGGGKGGIDRGRGDAPLTFAGLASDAGLGKSQALEEGDLSRAALGDKLGVQLGAHEVDPDKAQGPQSAGMVSSSAQGGDVVWVDRLTPAEKASLKEFFK